MHPAKLIGLALLTVSTLQTRSARAQPSNPFDGQWSVAVVCDRAPDGALGYTWRFSAEVRGGMLRGVYGILGEESSLELAGQIPANGVATLMAHGFTGSQRQYNAGAVGGKVPFSYRVSAQFAGGQGEGTRLETRPCKLHFVKQ